MGKGNKPVSFILKLQKKEKLLAFLINNCSFRQNAICISVVQSNHFRGWL